MPSLADVAGWSGFGGLVLFDMSCLVMDSFFSLLCPLRPMAILPEAPKEQQKQEPLPLYQQSWQVRALTLLHGVAITW